MYVSLLHLLKRMTSVAQELENEIYANTTPSEYNSWSEIQTTEDGYKIELSVPNHTKSDIQIQIADNRVLTILGKDVQRSIYLPEDANPDNIKATIENDVLLVTIPKMTHTPPTLRTITIQ
jgi:HSP20 family molecular chaperone IbpA